MTRVAYAAGAAFVGCAAAFLSAQAPPDGQKLALVQQIESRRESYASLAQQIWRFAELGYQETRSSALLQQQLVAAGFQVKAGVAEIPTAFVATYGTGKPVIALVGEFDALPGLSQEAQTALRRPIAENGPGHGCGHNLLGTGTLAAAVAIRDWLASGHTGTVRYYGTPAEEGGSGKVYMLGAGLFRDVDAVVGWHPQDRNAVVTLSSTATISGKFRFHGVAAHTGSAPDRGRSALDAVEAMDHMANMMREHVPQETRISYIISRGGSSPNIVPELAEVYYQVRQPDMKVLESIWQRIGKAAEGAAQGTGTTMDFEITSAAYNTLPNDYLAGLMYNNLERVGGFSYTPEEQRFAEQIRKTLIDPQPASLGSEQSVRPRETAGVDTFSTDLADVSWNVPTVQVSGAAFVPGVANHTWQATACAGSSIGIKAMMVAAKSMALTTYDLFLEPANIAKARAEFDRRRGADFVYTTPLTGHKPPLDYRK